MARRHEVWVLLVPLLVIASVMRLSPAAPEARTDGLAIWGIQPGMAADEVVRAFGRAPAEKRTCQGREVWFFCHELGLWDAVAMFDSEGRVEAVCGSAIEVQGTRFYTPLQPRRSARLFGDTRTSLGGSYYTESQVGFQERCLLYCALVVPGHSGRRHRCDWTHSWGSVAWLGGPHPPILAVIGPGGFYPP